jgi:hypothetical protein
VIRLALKPAVANRSHTSLAAMQWTKP